MKSFIYVGFIIMAIVACKKATQDEESSDSDSMSVKEIKTGEVLITKTEKGKWKIKCVKTGKTEEATTYKVMTTDFCGTKSLAGSWGYTENTKEPKGILILKLIENKDLKECKTSFNMEYDILDFRKVYDLTAESKYSITHNSFASKTRTALNKPSTVINSNCKNVKGENVRVIYKNVPKTQVNTPATDTSISAPKGSSTTCTPVTDTPNNALPVDKCPDGDKSTYKIGNGTYTGKCKNGKANGSGILTYTDGEYYEGNFKEGLRDGDGTRVLTDGTKVKVTWKEGCLKTGN